MTTACPSSRRPPRPSAVALRLDSAQDHASGLETINGRWAPGNETATKVTLENGRAHALAVGVRPEGDNVHITATLDGRSIVDWTGPTAALALRENWALGRDGVPGLGAYLSTVTFEHVRLTMRSGEARLGR
ncbi:MAG: hypothetical protein R6X20_13850 [Phycisphaerae bacterium]